MLGSCLCWSTGLVGGCIAWLTLSYRSRPKTLRLLKIAIDVSPEKPKGNLFFIHGWPDHGGLWMPMIEKLRKTYRCVAIDLPGCGTDSNASSWGYSYPELVEMVNMTVKSTFAGESVNLVAHDWGSVIGNLAMEKQPDLFNNFIGFDVAPVKGDFTEDKSIVELLMIVAYWSINVMIFLLYNLPMLSYLSNALQKLWFNVLLSSAWKKGPEYVVEISSKINYLYFHALMNVSSLENKSIPENRAQFFISKDQKYGRKEYRDTLKGRSDGSEYIIAKQSEHWIMLDEPDLVIDHMSRFLEKYA